MSIFGFGNKKNKENIKKDIQLKNEDNTKKVNKYSLDKIENSIVPTSFLNEDNYVENSVKQSSKINTINNPKTIFDNNLKTRLNTEIKVNTEKDINNKFIIEPNIQIIKYNPDEKVFSYLSDFASTRPIGISYDLTKKYIDDNIYALDILSTNEDLVKLVSQYPNLKYLDLNGCDYINDFSPIANLKNLEEVDFADCKNLKDISFLKNLTNLRVLNLGVTDITDISALENLINLEILDLRFTKIKDITVLKNLKNLRDLSLWGTNYLSSLDGIQYCTKLKSLDLTNCAMLTSIEKIRNLTELNILLMDYDNIADLSPISNLKKIKFFSMSNSRQMISEEQLKHFENLNEMKVLYLSNRMIKTLYYFRNMTNMQDLDLSSNVISDLTPLSSMLKIEKLNLNACLSLTDLSPLKTLVNMKKFKISGKQVKGDSLFMQISDLSVLKYMPKLEVIESTYNKKIKDISSLYFCKKLEEAHFTQCMLLEDITPLRGCPNLIEVYFNDCPMVTNIKFLRHNVNLKFIEFAKTNIDPASLTVLNRCGETKTVKGPNVLPNDPIILASTKGRKDIYKSALKALKEDESKEIKIIEKQEEKQITDSFTGILNELETEAK